MHVSHRMDNAFQKLGRYLIVDEIAKGGMATVYRAKLIGVEGFEKEVAVKKILPYWSHQKEFINMLIDEAKILVHLEHTNIVQVIELAKEKNTFFIVMEFVKGYDLRKITNKLKELNQTLPLNLACYIIKKTCKGLGFAHSRTTQDNRALNIVHRDISPQNILIGLDGSVKVTDFGIAKILGKTTETAAGALKGKFSYMSPEQALGSHINHVSDIFSLGSVFYELVFLKKAFDGSSDLETINKVKNSCVPIPKKTHPALKKILNKSLKKNPDKRFQSTLEMRQAIKKFEASHGLYADQDELSKFLNKLFENEISEFTKKGRLIKTKTPTVITAIKKKNNENSNLTVIEPDTIVDSKIIQNVLAKPRLEEDTTMPLKLRLYSPLDVIHRPKTVMFQLNKTQKNIIAAMVFIIFLGIVFLEISHKPETRTETEIEIEVETKQATPIELIRLPSKSPIKHQTANILQPPDPLRPMPNALRPTSLETGLLKVTARPWGRVKISDGKAAPTPFIFKTSIGKQTVSVTYPPLNKTLRKEIRLSQRKLIHCRATFNRIKSYMVCK